MTDHQPINDYIINAFLMDGKNGGTRILEKEISDKVKSQDLVWVHLDVRHPDTKTWLEYNLSGLDPLIVNALLAEETKPRITEFQNGALVILRSVNLNDSEKPKDMISIRFWIDGNNIISTRLRKLKSVEDIRRRIEAGTSPVNAADFFVDLATRMFERMKPVIFDLDERTDDIKETLLENADISLRHDIVDIRKKAIVLRRYIAPKKEVM